MYLSTTQLRILRSIHRLQQQSDPRGVCYREIADAADVSYNTVRLHVVALQACGALNLRIPRESSRGRPYYYEVLVDVPNSPPPSLA